MEKLKNNKILLVLALKVVLFSIFLAKKNSGSFYIKDLTKKFPAILTKIKKPMKNHWFSVYFRLKLVLRTNQILRRK